MEHSPEHDTPNVINEIGLYTQRAVHQTRPTSHCKHVCLAPTPGYVEKEAQDIDYDWLSPAVGSVLTMPSVVRRRVRRRLSRPI